MLGQPGLVKTDLLSAGIAAVGGSIESKGKAKGMGAVRDGGVQLVSSMGGRILGEYFLGDTAASGDVAAKPATVGERRVRDILAFSACNAAANAALGRGDLISRMGKAVLYDVIASAAWQTGETSVF